MSIVSVTVSSMSNLLSDYRINLPRGKHIETSKTHVHIYLVLSYYYLLMVSIKLPVLLSILIQIFPHKPLLKSWFISRSVHENNDNKKIERGAIYTTSQLNFKSLDNQVI